MHRIAINGINSKAGGGRSILFNYMKLLDQEKLEDQYFLLTRKGEEFNWISNGNIDVVKLPEYYGMTVLSPFIYEFLIDKWLKKKSIDILFNLCDLVVNSKILQVYLFDWSYAINPESTIWKRMSWKDWFSRKVKLYFLEKRLPPPGCHSSPDSACKKVSRETVRSNKRGNSSKRGGIG